MDKIEIPKMDFLRFIDKFPTEKTVIEYYIQQRYGQKKPKCNHCGSIRVYSYQDKTKIKFFRCGACNKDFSIFKGTIFEKSKTDLRKWFYAIHLMLNSKKGISGYQLQREIKVTYKCAWRILKKIRKAMGNDDDSDGGVLQGLVEIDECYIGGKAENKHMLERVKAKGVYPKDCT